MAPNISIRDLGPIGQADLDLKPLTIFVGPNNSGKSYVALTIYSLVRAIGGSDQYPGAVRRQFRARRHFGLQDRSSAEWDELRVVIRNYSTELRRLLSGEAHLQEMPDSIQELVHHESRNWAGPLSQIVGFELRRCFGVNLDNLGRRNRRIERGEFEINLSDHASGFRWGIKCQNDELLTTDWGADVSRGKMKLGPDHYPSIELVLNEPQFLLSMLTDAYFGYLLNGYSTQSHYLPASRSGILQGHNTLTKLIVGRASRAWIEPMDVGTLPGVITDLIEALLDLRRQNSPDPSLKRIIEFLESGVTKGPVDVAYLAGYPDISYKNEGGSFKLHEVSSMVSEIAPLVLFLKYLTKPGDLFVFEEPESHLDPANQRNLARAIAMMVNTGIRVLVTTHSDIFLNQINNLMQVSQVPSDTLSRMDYEVTEVLQPADVAAYLFRVDALDGTDVEHLPIDPGYGISTESFDNVHRALYDEAIGLERRG